MPDISPDVISRKLSINPSYKPIGKKQWAYNTERYKAMNLKVEKLTAIGFIGEVT